MGFSGLGSSTYSSSLSPTSFLLPGEAANKKSIIFGYSKGFSQDLETGRPDLAIVKVLGTLIFKGDHKI